LYFQNIIDMKTPILFFLLLVSFSCLSAQQDIFLLKSSGKVVIGDTTQITTPGNYNLYVQNGILTEKVKVSLKNTTEWSDSAFERCPDIQEVSQSISQNSHLYEMPSADALVKDGYELKTMDAKLLQQIEWLWQHMIRLDEENKALKAEINSLKNHSELPKK
jgi:trimeric autotransporter adhesin